jgi:hypothetical protein
LAAAEKDQLSTAQTPRKVQGSKSKIMKRRTRGAEEETFDPWNLKFDPSLEFEPLEFDP